MSEPNAFATVQQIAGGYCLSRCLHVVADLGVADALAETPSTAADLAAAVGADPDALGRVLRLLAAHGVFEVRGDVVSHSPASRLLRDDHPQSMRAFARLFGMSVAWATYGLLGNVVRTGLPAVSEIYADGHWAYLERHPDEGRVFNAAMADKARGTVPAILAAYDFAGFELIGDIGGGSGHLLRAVLEAAPAASGVLFDLPHVIAEATEIASSRLALRAGDFFRDALPRCAAYLLMEIIHDWGDEEAVAILRAVRLSAPPDATVLLIETLVPDDPGPDWSKVLDIHMLALLGGRQRTRREYATLLERSGFLLQREIDTGAGIAILEARAV
ncbi:MAG: hydroxyneurosporene methyltransferase [Chloroflexota bacterium]|nr:hydroxyneurosporene methyltransferase [Chloroflexota bacterium]